MADFKALFKQQSAEAAEALGHTDKGYKNLENSQQDLFNFGATKLGVEKGQNANETAGNIVSKLTSGLGTSTAADVLRAGLQTAATVGLDPANVVAPGAGMRGTVAKVGESAVAKKLAQQALRSGDMSTVNAIAKASHDNLLQIIPRAATRPQGLDIIKAARVPTSARGLKAIGGANEFANPAIKKQNLSRVSFGAPKAPPVKSAIKPANMTRVQVPTKESARQSAADKVSTSAAKGEKLDLSPGASRNTPIAQQVEIAKIVAKLRGK